MNTRKSGWYWVKWDGRGWEPAEWSEGRGMWSVAGNIGFIPEYELEDINENRLIPPNE